MSTLFQRLKTVMFGSGALKALPVVLTAAECADYAKTVRPFLSELRTLPSEFAAVLVHEPSRLPELYAATNPLVAAFAIALAISPVFLVAAEINRNYSQVDRFWSILPAAYAAHYALYTYAVGMPLGRIGKTTTADFPGNAKSRLTFNYWRRGGYQIGSEDYRWEILREQWGPALSFLLNCTFISFFQNVLLCSITVPIYPLLLSMRLPGGEELLTVDYIMAAIMLTCVSMTAVADQQQWNYHAAKASFHETSKVPAGYRREDLERGFLASGLWRYSRHPNFFFEQGVWATLFAWSCAVTGSVVGNWAAVGALAYSSLFHFSSNMTEGVTAGKYSQYAEYQRQVGRMVPGFGVWNGGSSASSSSGKSANGAAAKKRS